MGKCFFLPCLNLLLCFSLYLFLPQWSVQYFFHRQSSEKGPTWQSEDRLQSYTYQQMSTQFCTTCAKHKYEEFNCILKYLKLH